MSERSRLLLLAARTAGELRQQLDLDDRTLCARDDVDRVPEGGPHRLAILDADPRRLELARRVARGGASWRGRNDVWYAPVPLLAEGGGSVAVVFPGIEQRFDPGVDDLAAHLGVAPPDVAGDEHSVLQRAISLLAVGRLLDEALRRIGVAPAAVAGHSIGEWNAMMSAGMMSAAAMDRLIATIDPAAFSLPGCLFAALGCGADVTAEVIAGLDGVVISHDNCPHQSIVCGESGPIAAATKRFEERGILVQLLNFRSGFHSPLLAPYVQNVARVAELPIGPARVPVWSATTTAPFPHDEDAARELVLRHLLEPVRFRTLIERLYDSGVRAFVQAGVGSVTGFIDDTLGGREHLTVAASAGGQPGLRQLRRTAAALWVEGAAIRFDAFATPATPATHPVLVELEALLAEAADAARTVAARYAAPAPRSTRYRWTLRIDDMPYVEDHCLVRQAAGWPVLADRCPVVPLTTTFELMRDVARKLVPERTPIALRNVAALRWLALDRPLDLDVTATYDGRGAVEVDLGGYARATVVLADGYPDAPLGDTAPFVNERCAPANAAQLYADRWLFHGPRFQGVTDVGRMGDDGLRGTVQVLESPGALVDTAGQLMVFWIMAALDTDRYALPGGVAAVEYFGPPPPAGHAIAATVRIRSVTPRAVYADLELAGRDGRVYARLSGFENRRFSTDDVVWPVLTYPELHTLGDTQPGGWVRLSERWADAASREMIARRYLGAAERDEDRARAPRGRRHWLMGRIAAKDAVRRWLWDRGAGPLFPAEVTIVSDGRGRPTVNVAGSSPVGVSIAHSGDLAVAIAGENAVGIDVEAVASRDPAMEALALTDAERVLLDRFAARDVAFTRFWAAKEAVSKAEGTGLEGRPTAFTVVAADHEQLRVHCAGSAREYAVDTTLIDGSPSYVVAWTRGESSANHNVPTYGGTISCETTLKSSSSRTSAGTSAR